MRLLQRVEQALWDLKVHGDFARALEQAMPPEKYLEFRDNVNKAWAAIITMQRLLQELEEKEREEESHVEQEKGEEVH